MKEALRLYEGGKEDMSSLAARSVSDLKNLAWLIVHGKMDEAKEEANKVIREFSARPNDVFDALFGMCKAVKEANAMSDAELTQEVSDKVWGNMCPTSREAALLQELVDRFSKKGGC